MDRLTSRELHGAVDLQDHLDLLAEISEAFATSQDIDTTLQRALERVMDYLHAEAASLFLLQDGGRVLRCRACAGPMDIKGLELAGGRGVVWRAVHEDRVLRVRDVRQEASFNPAVDAHTGFETRSILCAPLRLRASRIGALELINKRGGALFDDRDERVLAALAASASMVIHNATLAASLVEHERLQKELELAADIQRKLLPAESTGGPVYGLNVPAREISGDFFDFFTLPHGCILFTLGDVSGKGMNAALLMAKTASLFHCLGKQLTAPGRLLGVLNDEIHERGSRGMFVTMVAGLYDPVRGRLRFANAGHPPPLREDRGGRLRAYPADAPPLGVLAGTRYPEHRLQLPPGTAFYVYSDGLSEAPAGPGQRPLGIRGVRRLIRRYRPLPPAERLAAMAEAARAAGGRLHDDLTLLLVEGP